MDYITVHIHGDFGPFSRVGKSIGYQVTIGRSNFLIDCGAPIFQQIGGHGLKAVDFLIITHCHDDHKRWFSDLALFSRYAPDIQRKIKLITTEAVHDSLVEASTPALFKSLSGDSGSVIDLAYEDFIEYQMIGPRAKYRIVSREEGKGKFGLYITDLRGHVVPADKAKIIISQKTKKPRMLFYDPDYGEWVEPESFYPFSSTVFYEEDRNVYHGADGFTVEAIKSPVWHGITGMGVKIRKGEDTMIFSSDTAHDTGLWKRLCSKKRLPILHMPKREFNSASVIYGDINDYIERTWSRERYHNAINAFKGAAVLHDISTGNSVVHTDYEKLSKTMLKKDSSLLTHSPDRFTSEWALCNAGKTYEVRGGKFLESAGGKLYPLNADIYHKENGKFYAGYKNKNGKHTVHRKDGRLHFVSFKGSPSGRPLYKVDLYEDLSGKYYPKLENANAMYYERSDGKVELVELNEQGSNGRIVSDLRADISKRRNGKSGS